MHEVLLVFTYPNYLRKRAYPPKTCIPSRFPIKNMHTSEVENVHGVCVCARFQEIPSVFGEFWVNIIPK